MLKKVKKNLAYKCILQLIIYHLLLYEFHQNSKMKYVNVKYVNIIFMFFSKIALFTFNLYFYMKSIKLLIKFRYFIFIV